MNADVFQPTNQLEQAMQGAARDPQMAAAFLAALADAELLVPLNAPPQGDVVEFPHFAVDGVDHIAVFTSEAQLDRAQHPRVGALQLTGRVLAQMWPPDMPMAINPRGDLGLSLPAPDVQALSAPPGGGAGERHIPAGSELIVGAPAEEPGEVLKRLSAEAATLSEVLAMHRALVKVKDSPEPPWLAVGVALAPETQDAQPVLARLAETAGREVSLLPLTDEASDPISAWMLELNEPFYRAS